MQAIAVSGPRKLTARQGLKLKEYLKGIRADRILVGDASGVDGAARLWWPKHEIYTVQGTQPWCYAERTIRMIDAIAAAGGTLYAFPNKSCPDKCKPAQTLSGGGSGTWLAISAAVYRGVPVVMMPLEENIALPYWLKAEKHMQQRYEQLTLNF